MYFKQFYLGCLAQASYLIGSKGEAAAIDPIRDVGQYLETAQKNDLKIKYVIETHIHADFVSGHKELASITGATILMGKLSKAKFDFIGVSDEQEIGLGNLTLKFFETPGHTPESIIVQVSENAHPESAKMLFTGDTLFIGDVGRPDLVSSLGHSADEMADQLYDSLHKKFMSLPDNTLIYPAHGAGSLCGRFMSSETFSTLGEQKRTNYALQPMPRDDFIRMATTDLPEIPAYFSRDVEMNITGAMKLEELPPLKPLTPRKVQALKKSQSTVLDTRSIEAFGTAHLPGSVHIGLNGQFAPWAGALLKEDRPIVLVTQGVEEAKEAKIRLSRVGIENIAGYLDGGVAAWEAEGLPLMALSQLRVEDLANLRESFRQMVDVRRPSEFESGHIPGAVNIPLDKLLENTRALNEGAPTYVICGSGYRSSIGCSLLQKVGLKNVFNIGGGMQAWRLAKLPLKIHKAA